MKALLAAPVWIGVELGATTVAATVEVGFWVALEVEFW
jgi:hypothetical protein